MVYAQICKMPTALLTAFLALLVHLWKKGQSHMTIFALALTKRILVKFPKFAEVLMQACKGIQCEEQRKLRGVRDTEIRLNTQCKKDLQIIEVPVGDAARTSDNIVLPSYCAEQSDAMLSDDTCPIPWLWQLQVDIMKKSNSFGATEFSGSPCKQSEQTSRCEFFNMTDDTDVDLASDSDSKDLTDSSVEADIPIVANDHSIETRSIQSLTIGKSDRLSAEQAHITDPSVCEVVHGDADKGNAIEAGDIVVLERGVPQEYCNHIAIVTSVANCHCTVAVLDESRRYGIGECWPAYEDIALESTCLRLGTRVVISGLQNPRTKHLNDQVGIISKHPRQGHPVFVTKNACPASPQLTVCVAFEDAFIKERSALLEPRFLTNWQDACRRNSLTLADQVALLREATKTPS